jgi:ureidoacrylate peracid hydrolase
MIGSVKKFYLSKYKLEPFLFALGFCTVFQVIHYIPLPGIMSSYVCNKNFMDVAELVIMLRIQVGKTALSFGLVVVDMQNGFVSKGGSYDKLGMNIEAFRKIIPRMRILIAFCRNEDIPIFYTEAVRERSGIDLLTNIHMILPRTREERLKVPITVRGTWDSRIIDEIKPGRNDHVIIKRRDSAFQDTELRVWLQSVGINTLIFCGIDTSICVETSLRDGFNLGYDVILISDATASGVKKHYETTLERVRDYYGIVTSINGFEKIIKLLKQIEGGTTDYNDMSDARVSRFLEKHNLIDLRRVKQSRVSRN